MSFAKVKEYMLNTITTEMVLVIVAFVFSLISMGLNSQFDVQTIIIQFVICAAVFALLFAAKNMTKKGSVYGGVLALLAGIACFFVSILTFIVGVVLVVTALVFLVKFNKKK